MGIDWFTLLAQIFNLMILLFLLRKFLYLPVLKAVEIRQKMISDELKNAEQSRLKAQNAEKLCLKKAKEIEREKQKILADAQHEAEKLAADLRVQAENQYRKSQYEWKERLNSESKNFNIAVQKLTAEHFNRFAEKALRQMANSDLNKWIIEQFTEKVRSLPIEEKIKLQENLQSSKILQVESAQELSPTYREQIENLMRSECKLKKDVQFIYKINSSLIAGIIIQGGEYMLEWSLNGYLQEFKQTMAEEVSRLINRGAA